jgi:hypothetical protein
MAIPEGIASLLIEEHTKRPFRGRLLQLGQQDTYVSSKALRGILRQRGFEPHNQDELSAIADSGRPLSDRELFGIFGFSSIEATDASDYEGADFVYDLNSVHLPGEHTGSYDCIFDGGTMEHVFHTPNALSNIFHLLKTGGRVVHYSPASNAVDHGFYSFSPCFFLQYYSANRFRIECCKLLNLGTKLLPLRFTAYDCRPPIPRTLLDGYLSGKVHYVFFVATKTDQSVCTEVPQQTVFADMWREPAAIETVARQSLLSTVKDFIKSRPGLARAVRSYAVPALRFPRILESRRYLRKLAQRY